MGDTRVSGLAAVSTALSTTELAANDASVSKRLTVDVLHTYMVTADAYAPGSLTVATGKFVMMTKQLVLTGSQRLTLQGTARLRIT